MSEKSKKVLNALIGWGFVLYFLILLTERVLALVFSIHQGGVYALDSFAFIGIATYSITALAVLGGLIAAAICFGPLFPALFGKGEFDFREGGGRAIVPSMVLLLAGMMHTGYTLAPIQFVAYGFLILSMILVTVLHCLENKEKRFEAIVSVIYLVLFSMAIPVCYSISDTGPVGISYYVAEFLCVFALIPMFARSLFSLFGKGRDPFHYPMVVTMVALDAFIIGLKWKEEINWFLLIFAALSFIFYLCFFLTMWRRDRKD